MVAWEQLESVLPDSVTSPTLEDVYAVISAWVDPREVLTEDQRQVATRWLQVNLMTTGFATDTSFNDLRLSPARRFL